MSDKKVLLVDLLPPRNLPSGKKSYNYTLALILVKNLLEKEDLGVEIMNPLKKISLNALKKEKNPYKKTAELVASRNPTHVGFSITTSSSINAIILAEEIKKINSEIKIFLGGPETNVLDKKILNNFSSIDFICRGEVEKIIPRLAKYIKGTEKLKNIQNITFREGRDIKRNSTCSPLKKEELPAVDYEKEDIGEIIRIEGGRGCPYNCTFCSTSIYWNKNFRPKPINKLVKEIKVNKNYFKTNTVSIVHDSFTGNKKRIKEFCKKMRGTGIRWNCSSRIDLLTPDVIDMMEESGCINIRVGIESGSQKIQKKIKKNLNLKKADAIIKHVVNNTKISITTFFIVGLPSEKPEDLYQTLKKISSYGRWNQCEAHVYWLRMRIGSLLYEEEKDNLFFDPAFYTQNHNLVMDSKRELKLIKKFPDIFSTHYGLRIPGFSPYFFPSIKNIFSALVVISPKSLDMWMRTIDDSQLLFKEIKKMFDWGKKYFTTKEELLETFQEKNVIFEFWNYLDSTRGNNEILKVLKKEITNFNN